MIPSVTEMSLSAEQDVWHGITPKDAFRKQLTRFMDEVKRELIQILIKNAITLITCPECFGTGLRGGFNVPCSRGHRP